MMIPKTSVDEIRKLSKPLLIEATHRLTKEERRITVELLWHLREIDHRKIPQEMGMSGIFDYCVRVLNYSEGSAFRRVQSMRALRENPELEKSILEGKITLTTASNIQTFLQRAKRQGIKVLQPGETQKAEFFSRFEGLSSRRVEQKLSEISPTLARREHERHLNDHELEVRLTISTQTKERWVRISELAAHRINFEPSTRRIVELSAELALTELEKEKTGSPTKYSASPFPHESPIGTSRRIPIALRRLVWWRDQGRCTYRTHGSSIRCPSRFALEIDHIKPFSIGGSSLNPENLRLLCKPHHQLLTRNTFGEYQARSPALERESNPKGDEFMTELKPKVNGIERVERADPKTGV